MKENKSGRQYRPKTEYADLKSRAEVLYIKHGLSLKAIGEQFNLSTATVHHWKTLRWDELRPDLETLNQYKAAGMYIEKGLNESEISEKLNVSKDIINMWIDLYGWEAARHISAAQDVTADIVAYFCQHFKKLLPALAGTIDFAQADYIKSIKPIIKQNTNPNN
jgi:uncharacterized protein YjcR